MNIKYLTSVACKLYRCRIGKIINYRWIPVFWLRCLVSKKEVESLESHFNSTEIGRSFLEHHPHVWFQLLRENFYRNSKASERLKLIIDTWKLIEKHFSDETRQKIYCHEIQGEPHQLWQMDYNGKPLKVEINFIDGEIKEGCICITLKLDDLSVFHMNLWAVNRENKLKAYIGCYQGSRDGLDVNRELTKFLFGCRPQNFLFVALQEFVKALGITELYAVSSYGHYSNKFHSSERKPKISYDEFWQECGGTLSSDKRFYSMPLEQQRKTYEEIPTKKRAYYRKRYELLDQMTEAIKSSIS